MYSLIFIFFSIPLYFSHVFAPVGLIIGETLSFERQKVLLFIGLVLIALIELVATHKKLIIHTLKQYGYIFLMFLVLPIVGQIFQGHPFDDLFFIGSIEKHHGYIYYLGLVILVFFLAVITPKERSKLILPLLWSSSIVAVIAIWEYIFGSPFFFIPKLGYEHIGRSIATLGNPNYVAGLLLPLLPIICSLKSNSLRRVLSILFVLALLTTKSYIGIVGVLFYGLYLIVKFTFGTSKKITQLGIYTLIVFGALIGGLSLIDPEKHLSLQSRGVLMWETLQAMIQQPMIWLSGSGPDTLWQYFLSHRTALLDAYFPPDWLIDSSHNIFIDMLFQFGIIPIIVFIIFMWQYRRGAPPYVVESLVLFLFFFLLNVVVLSHMLILFLFLSLYVGRPQDQGSR